MIYILSGFYQQAADYARNKGINNWKYVAEGSEVLRGIRHPIIIKIGTWKDRKDILAITRELELCQAVMVEDKYY